MWKNMQHAALTALEQKCLNIVTELCSKTTVLRNNLNAYSQGISPIHTLVQSYVIVCSHHIVTQQQ